ncbi:MAG TPA: immune inhibitor A domain-containing protein [Longimicrobium sp.]|uniref:immune inhibitor A domain-containing protein n=1 Tax=Longimicrobium sp. TaxID=2029185 RepID=UPI002ED95F27
MRTMLMRAALAALAALAAVPAAAQDVEILSQQSGIPLPQGYWDRVRRDPGFFETRRGWRNRLSASPGGPLAATAPARGNLRMAVLLGLFSDSPEPVVTSAALQQQLFGTNPMGNLTQYYHEISLGRMNITGTVGPWVRTSLPRAEVVGQSYGLGIDASLGWYLIDVLARSDQHIDFGQFDNDGPDNVPNSGDDDGYVDLAAFQFNEVAASCGGPGVWPHRSWLTGLIGVAYSTRDLRPDGHPIMVDDYHMQSSVECDGTPQSISVMAHETGHAFGLPDWYDASEGLLPAERRWVHGCWTLMAGGSWGCGDGASFGKTPRPSHLGPLDKIAMGWAAATRAQPGWRRTYTLNPVQQSGDLLQVPLVGEFEFLLLEYRPNTGFDSELPAGGVLVHHIDLFRPLRLTCFTCPRLYYWSLLEADGDGALRRSAGEGGNRGAAGDIFNGRRLLDDRSQPVLALNSGQPAGVAMEIDVSGGQARITVSTVPTVATAPLLAPLLGSAGGPLTADERAALDYFGNRDGAYDLGDLRVYMRYRPTTVRQGA